MELLCFHDRLYGKYNSQLFTFEPTWDSFRPINGIGWNGKTIIPLDSEYKKDLFDPFYGYGSLEMKTVCKKLTAETELSQSTEVKNPLYLWRWYGEKNITWWRDRPCVFASPCVERDVISWKKYLNYLETRAKTLRKPFNRRLTKRLLPK